MNRLLSTAVAFLLPALLLGPLSACSGDDDSGGPACSCTAGAFSFTCGTETCINGELVVCSAAAELSSGGACTAPADGGTSDTGPSPVDAGRDSGAKPDASPVDASGTCSGAATFSCGGRNCQTGAEYCNAVVASGAYCAPLPARSCAKCADSAAYTQFSANSSSVCGGKRTICFDGAAGGQMTWGCQ
jgi:hypothetical protein